MSLPFHWIQIWDGKCFIKSSLLEQGFVMHLRHNGQSCPVQSIALDDVSMAGAEEEEEQEENLAEDVSGIMGGQDTLVIAHSNGVFHHCIQWCACLASAPHHIQLFRHGLFSASVIRPKTAFTFDVLDHFYMDAMECKTAGWSFFQKLRRFTNNAAPASVPVGPHHHDSGHLTDGIISEPLQRASTCVPAVAEPPGFEKVWIWPWKELRPWPMLSGLVLPGLPTTRHQSSRGLGVQFQ